MEHGEIFTIHGVHFAVDISDWSGEGAPSGFLDSVYDWMKTLPETDIQKMQTEFPSWGYPTPGILKDLEDRCSAERDAYFEDAGGSPSCGYNYFIYPYLKKD